jgi:hypothetical protein
MKAFFSNVLMASWDSLEERASTVFFVAEESSRLLSLICAIETLGIISSGLKANARQGALPLSQGWDCWGLATSSQGDLHGAMPQFCINS